MDENDSEGQELILPRLGDQRTGPPQLVLVPEIAPGFRTLPETDKISVRTT